MITLQTTRYNFNIIIDLWKYDELLHTLIELKGALTQYFKKMHANFGHPHKLTHVTCAKFHHKHKAPYLQGEHGSQGMANFKP